MTQCRSRRRLGWGRLEVVSHSPTAALPYSSRAYSADIFVPCPWRQRWIAHRPFLNFV